MKLPEDVADPKAAPFAAAEAAEAVETEADPPVDEATPEALPAEALQPCEPAVEAVEVEDTTMAGLAKRASQASRLSQASQATANALAQATESQVVPVERSDSGSPRTSEALALQDAPAELPPTNQRDAAPVTPRKSQAKAASGLLNRASRAVGALTSGTASATRNFTAECVGISLTNKVKRTICLGLHTIIKVWLMIHDGSSFGSCDQACMIVI